MNFNGRERIRMMVEFEHSLFKLLLLVAVLSARPPGRKWLPFVIGVGLLLALLPPPLSIPIPWSLFLGLTIPLLLWQNARRIITAQWSGRWSDVLIWIGSAVLFALVFFAFKELELFGAVLFGLVTASLIWSASETEREASMISLIGPFTLIFLLFEVEPMIQSPTQYAGGIFSGLSFGAVIAVLAVFLSRRADPKLRNWISLAQIYLAYLVADLIGVSAVAASLASVIVFVSVGLYFDLWPFQKIEPSPLNTWPGFVLILAVFLLLGLQAHYPPSSLLILEVAASFFLSMAVAWLGKRCVSDVFPQSLPLWPIGLRISLLLFPVLLIWPEQTLQQPILLAYAFGLAVIFLILTRITIDYFFK
jgi:hypothetical protein